MGISSKTKMRTAVVVVLIVMLFVLFFLPRRASKTPPVEPVSSSKNISVASSPSSVVSEPSVVDEEQAARVEAATMARLFVERFGSYSTESHFANVVDVFPLASPAFQSVLERSLATSSSSSVYYGVTTRVLSVEEVLALSSEQEKIFDVLTQREEAYGSLENISVTYQTMRVEIGLSDGIWKVEEAEWRSE